MMKVMKTMTVLRATCPAVSLPSRSRDLLTEFFSKSTILNKLHHDAIFITHLPLALTDDLMSLLDAGAPGDHNAVLMDAESLMPEDIIAYPIRTRVTGRQSQAASGHTHSLVNWCHTVGLL